MDLVGLLDWTAYGHHFATMPGSTVARYAQVRIPKEILAGKSKSFSCYTHPANCMNYWELNK